MPFPLPSDPSPRALGPRAFHFPAHMHAKRPMMSKIKMSFDIFLICVYVHFCTVHFYQCLLVKSIGKIAFLKISIETLLQGTCNILYFVLKLTKSLIMHVKIYVLYD